MPDMCIPKIILYEKRKLPFNSHYFKVQDNEFNQWIKNKISFKLCIIGKGNQKEILLLYIKENREFL